MVAEMAVERNSGHNNANKTITRNTRDEEEEDEKEEAEKKLVVPPEGTEPPCAMGVVPPGISSGTTRASKDRASDSESLIPKNIGFIPCTDRLS